MMNTVEFYIPSLQDIRDVVQAVVREELLGNQKSTQNARLDELLTIKETAELLKVSTVTLWDWSKKGVLKKHYIYGNPRYKRSEVIEALVVMESKNRVA